MKSTLTANQLLLTLTAVRNNLRERLSRRHLWRTSCSSLTADPARLAEAYAELRELIAAYRSLERQYARAWNREFERTHRLAA